MAKSMFSAAYRQLVAAVVEARKAGGLTQRDLAKKLGRPQNYVGRVETEQRRLDFVELLAWLRACDADVDAAIARLTKDIGHGNRRPGTNRTK